MTTARSLRGPFDYRLPEELREGNVEVGSMLVVPFGRRQVLGVVVGLADRSEVADEKLLAPLRAIELGVPADLVALAEWIAAEFCSTISRALGLVLPPDATRRLSGRRRREVALPRHLGVGASRREPPRLTDDQREALAPLIAALRERRHESRLLNGVTGSGKTEVYLRAAAEALGQGRGAIVLVPEIALTPQIVGRFIDRFGDTVAVLHSRLTPGQRYVEWRRLREGRARVCVGPRSAVFAPIEELGLIVLDEEHDASYKHEGDPRYDARDVAARRAKDRGAVLLLGSATPRPETVARTSASVLPRRVDDRPLPPVRVLDMRGEPHGLHPVTAAALADTRAAGGKAIVLLNRRGWSNFLSCRSCGRVWGCPDCDVALVLHGGRPREGVGEGHGGRGGHLSCHHCGHREPAPERCPSCSSASVARHGAGTERLEHDLAELFRGGDFPVFRLDADAVEASATAARNGAAAADRAAADNDRAAVAPGDAVGNGPEDGVGALLRRFEASDGGVLMGTQMVAKGHDFPDVSLGVVLDADSTLRFPDFRAEERTFALIAQLAGRVGRGGEGAVLIQTIAPEARAIRCAAAHDGAGFLAGELERRRALAYPPYSHLIRVVLAASEARPAQAAAEAVRARLALAFAPEAAAAQPGANPVAGANPVVLGPASLFRLRGRERRMLVVKAGERRAAVSAVGEAVQQVAGEREHGGVSFSVDVDPQ